MAKDAARRRRGAACSGRCIGIAAPPRGASSSSESGTSGVAGSDVCACVSERREAPVGEEADGEAEPEVDCDCDCCCCCACCCCWSERRSSSCWMRMFCRESAETNWSTVTPAMAEEGERKRVGGRRGDRPAGVYTTSQGLTGGLGRRDTLPYCIRAGDGNENHEKARLGREGGRSRRRRTELKREARGGARRRISLGFRR